MAVFQRILVAWQIEQAVTNTLITWYPTYLREIEKQLDLPIGQIASPKKYTNRNRFEGLAPEDLPIAVVISPGLAGAPVAKGGGIYRASWRVGVGIATSAPDENIASMLSKVYGAGARAILLQHQSLDKSIDGIAEVTWLDENYDDLPVPNAIQQFKAAGEWFSIDVENVTTRYAGPKSPDEDPYAYGTANEIDIEIIKEAVA